MFCSSSHPLRSSRACLCDRLEEVGALLEQLQPSRLVSAADLTGLRAVHERLGAGPRLSGRPLHGDAHLNNLLWGPDGPVWTDLENACSGPPEYDLACIAWRAVPGTEEALPAYGHYDPAAIRRCEPYLALFLAAWTIVVVERKWTAAGAEEARRRIERALA